MSIEVNFRVRCAKIAVWEEVFVVGDTGQLGSWQPNDALCLTPTDETRHTWEGAVVVDSSTKELLFRYFIGYKLDSATESSQMQIIVARWEGALNPRRCLPALEARNGRARETYTDDFGKFDGKELITDGWIVHENEHVVLLRIHGEALKFYKQRFKNKVTRLKIVPFDVRFKETFRPYDARERHIHKNGVDRVRGLLWRLSSVYGQTRDTIDEDGPEEEKDPALPDVPSFSNTELSVLTREDPIFGEQYVNGSVFRNDVDYLCFRTKTVSIEHLAFRIELYHDKERVAMAYALPATLPDTYGKSTFPIICNQHMPIGQLNVDYMMVKPLEIDRTVNNSMNVTFGRYWRKRKTLEVGHRGMGNSYTKIACERENTIQSLKEAGKKGADLVEFDVQLTKDMQPVIYHDFHVLVEVASRNGSIPQHDPYHELAIKDLKMAQLNLLHFEHVHVKGKPTVGEDCTRVVPTKTEKLKLLHNADANDEEYNPFPLLENALRTVNSHVGFNIEVKFPMLMKDGTHECVGYFERNMFIDTILKCVFSYCGKRRIVFSCFDPDICTLLTQKQHRFPVLFLVVGATTRYMPFQDIRSDCSKLAVHYAAANGLLGVNFHSEELLKDRNPVRLAEKYSLVSFVWGDDLNLKQHQQYFRDELKVDGVIYDRIGEFEQRQNVFLVEARTREALFVKSPVPSRNSSRRNSVSSRSNSLERGRPFRRSNSQDGRSPVS